MNTVLFSLFSHHFPNNNDDNIIRVYVAFQFSSQDITKERNMLCFYIQTNDENTPKKKDKRLWHKEKRIKKSYWKKKD